MKLTGGILRLFVAAAAMISASSVAAAQEEDYPQEVYDLLATYQPQHGRISIPEAKATLDLRDDYLFYDAEDAQSILVQLWGNPPESAEGVLGMVIPAGMTPVSDTWGAVLSYEDTGHIADDDAADEDYAKLMKDMQADARENSDARREAGYSGLEIIGWAETPNYDKVSHSVVWAQNIKFEDSDFNTLNYDVRALGREGVLSMNLVSSMPELESTKLAARDLASHVSFNPGARYADYDPSVDRLADYGIGGLVAAGVGMGAAKKFGLLAILLKFIKPILLGAFALLAVFGRKIMGLFGRKEDEWGDE